MRIFFYSSIYSYPRLYSSLTLILPLYPKVPIIYPLIPLTFNVTFNPIKILGLVSFWNRSLTRILSLLVILSTFPLFIFCFITFIWGNSFSASWNNFNTWPWKASLHFFSEMSLSSFEPISKDFSSIKIYFSSWIIAKYSFSYSITKSSLPPF